MKWGSVTISSMAQEFDLIVIGTGAAATTAATACAKAGWRVAIVDERPFGGTCPLRGCDPKKVLVGAGELADWTRRMHEIGVAQNTVRIDWPALMRFKRTFTDPVPAERERLYADAKIQAFHGTARFQDATTMRVGGELVKAKHFLIASGAKPMPLHIAGEELLMISDDFMELEQLPSPIVFVGGGFISFEFAHLVARIGVQAHIIEVKSRPLHGFDPDLVDRLVEAATKLGIQMHTYCKVRSLEKSGDRILVRAEEGGEHTEIAAALVVHGGGRVPNLDGLQLDAARIERTEKGVKVNEFLQSVSNPHVYAAGDAADAGGLPLTPVAGLEGEAAAENLLRGNHRTVDFTGLASIVYTVPALAHVGLAEAEARERGLQIKVNFGDTSDWYSSRRTAAKPSAYKILIDEGRQLVLGAHLLGPNAEEVANVFALAIRAKIPVPVLRETLFAYPTGSSDIEYMLE